MRKEIPDFFWWAVVLLALFLALIIFLVSLILFGLESVQSLLKEYSGILTGIIAVVVAFFTIRRQTKNVSRQIKTQLNIAEKNRFLDKKEELILTLGGVKQSLVSLSEDYSKGGSKKAYEPDNMILSKLDISLFLMIEYKFADRIQQKTFRTLVESIIALSSSEMQVSDAYYNYLISLEEESLDSRLILIKNKMLTIKNNFAFLEKEYSRVMKKEENFLSEMKDDMLRNTTWLDRKGTLRFKGGRVIEEGSIFSGSLDDLYVEDEDKYLIRYYWVIYKDLTFHLFVDLFRDVWNEILSQVYEYQYEEYVKRMEL